MHETQVKITHSKLDFLKKIYIPLIAIETTVLTVFSMINVTDDPGSLIWILLLIVYLFINVLASIANWFFFIQLIINIKKIKNWKDWTKVGFNGFVWVCILAYLYVSTMSFHSYNAIKTEKAYENYLIAFNSLKDQIDKNKPIIDSLNHSINGATNAAGLIYGNSYNFYTAKLSNIQMQQNSLISQQADLTKKSGSTLQSAVLQRVSERLPIFKNKDTFQFIIWSLGWVIFVIVFCFSCLLSITEDDLYKSVVPDWDPKKAAAYNLPEIGSTLSQPEPIIETVKSPAQVPALPGYPLRHNADICRDAGIRVTQGAVIRTWLYRMTMRDSPTLLVEPSVVSTEPDVTKYSENEILAYFVELKERYVYLNSVGKNDALPPQIKSIFNIWDIFKNYIHFMYENNNDFQMAKI